MSKEHSQPSEHNNNFFAAGCNYLLAAWAWCTEVLFKVFEDGETHGQH